MPKTVKIAAVQMKATPAPVQERLAQAEQFVVQAAQNGAKLVVLPEVFNTGYEYTDQNYRLAESFGGPTTIWMKQIAARYGVHLAGSFLRKEQNAIFNTLLLVAPNGRQWHYDKNYPWIWERAYFQKGTGITIAETELGKIGFLVCWDVAHTNLWQQYAGKVELMVVSSCPPKALDIALILPDGKRVMSRDTGALTQYARRNSDQTFGEYLRRQASCLGVPVAHSTSTGVFNSPFPNPQSSLAMFSVVYPPLLKYRDQFNQARMESKYFNETYITDPNGSVLQAVEPETEGVAISAVNIPDSPPQPDKKQPNFGIPQPLYWIDPISEMVFGPEYKEKVKKYLTEGE